MARPRKLVRDPRDSKVVFGLSINKSTGEHYSIGEDGKRVYWGRERRQAIDAFHASARPALADNAFVVISPPRIGVSVEHNKWIDVSRYSHALDALATVLTPQQVERMRPVVDHMIRWGESFGFPYQFTNVTGFDGLRKQREQELAAERTGRAVLGNRSDGKPSRERLSDCLKCWEQWKSSEGRSRAYIADVNARFQRFVAVVRDKPLNQLDAADFIKWEQWVIRESRKERTGKWHNDHLKAVAQVLRFARRKNREWAFPTGVLEWATEYEARKYQPGADNRTPIPPEVFRKLLAVCEEWSGIDPDLLPKNTQRGRAQRLQAWNRRREGVQLGALLRLAINCGLDNVDCTNIHWQHLRNLNGDEPFMSFPRSKVEWKTGAAIDRRTPLLPDTVAALRRWRVYEPVPSEHVFRTARRRPYASHLVGRAFGRLSKAAGVDGGWSFKHLRNVGPTLARRAKRHPDEREAFLGHAVRGTSRFYEGDVDQTFLAELVELIGEQYFRAAHNT